MATVMNNKCPKCGERVHDSSDNLIPVADESHRIFAHEVCKNPFCPCCGKLLTDENRKTKENIGNKDNVINTCLNCEAKVYKECEED